MINATRLDRGELPASLGLLDPHARLMAAVCARAAEELQSRNLLAALDALLWWLDPEAGPLWLAELGFMVKDTDLLPMLTGDMHHVTTRRARIS